MTYTHSGGACLQTYLHGPLARSIQHGRAHPLIIIYTRQAPQPSPPSLISEKDNAYVQTKSYTHTDTKSYTLIQITHTHTHTQSRNHTLRNTDLNWYGWHTRAHKYRHTKTHISYTDTIIHSYTYEHSISVTPHILTPLPSINTNKCLKSHTLMHEIVHTRRNRR